MAGYLSLAAKMVLNVHDLNNEGSVGQSLDIRLIRMVDENGRELKEMPAVSGRMMKHWHLEHMLRDELSQTNPKLCRQCRVAEPERKPQDESKGVKTCVICDSHGFLCTDKPGFSATVEISNNDIILKKEAKDNEPEERITVEPCDHQSPDGNCPTCALRDISGKKAKVTGELTEEDGNKFIKVSYLQSGRGRNKVEKGTSPKGLSLRRSSCVNFSWLLPALDKDNQDNIITPVSKQVIHSRVASGSEEETSQMIFHKTYASGIYGFVCSIDLGRIGKPLVGEGVSDTNEITRRKKLAVQALLPICLGAFGASQSHALPHAKCLGLLAALSTTEKPVPNLISPIYPNGFQESVALLEAMDDSVQYWTYGQADSSKQDQAQTENNDSDKEKRKSVATVQDVFKEILQAIDNEPKDK